MAETMFHSKLYSSRSYHRLWKGCTSWISCIMTLLFSQSVATGDPNGFEKVLISSVIPIDTVKFGIATGTINGVLMDVPVSISCQDTIYALDFSFRYNAGHVELDSVLNLTTGLQYLYYFNPQDSVFRFTSNRLTPYPCDSPVVVLRFESFNGQLCSYDLDSIITYINGDVCSHTLSGCLISSLPPSPVKSFSAYPNPANNELHITAPPKTSFIMMNDRGQPITEKMLIPESGELTIFVISFPPGLYLLMMQSAEGIAIRKVMVFR